MQANRNQSKQDRIAEYIAVDLIGEFDLELGGVEIPPPFFYLIDGTPDLPTNPPKKNRLWVACPCAIRRESITGLGFYCFLADQIVTGKVKIVDAAKISIRVEDIRTILSDFSLEPFENINDTRRGVTIFSADCIDPEKVEANLSCGIIERKIIRCLKDQTREKSPALEIIRDIAESLTNSTKPTESPNPATASAEVQDGEHNETAPALPPGVKIIEGKHLANDKGAAVPLTGELRTKFFSDVFPYIREVQAKEANPDRWSRPDKKERRPENEKNHRPRYHRAPNMLIELKGVRYWIAYCEARLNGEYVKSYTVKRDTANNSGVWFFFTPPANREADGPR